ncbi:MAG: hypothetical protein A2Y78_10180 [Acidobacteria bacterium RBG_13_68_16]|nr:MAG: hypothetical protein A2Y78_10180 [Acidobacteria bacterium RBG_13_68_16]
MRTPKVALNVKITQATKDLVVRHATRRRSPQSTATDELIRLGDLAYRFADSRITEREFHREVFLVAFPCVDPGE